MRRIYKYQLMEAECITARIEKFLHLDYQDGITTVWAIMNDDYPEVTYKIVVQGTGWDMPNDLDESTYIGTLQAGFFVWHYFAVPDRRVREYQKVYNDYSKDIYDNFKDKDFEIDMEQAIQYNEAFQNVLRQIIEKSPVAMH